LSDGTPVKRLFVSQRAGHVKNRLGVGPLQAERVMAKKDRKLASTPGTRSTTFFLFLI
jgi:hypothetical protein